MHIDFGFILCIAPGKGIKFEKAPFKFKNEYLEILGGQRSHYFNKFKKMMIEGFLAIQENADKIILLVEMMCLGQKDLPCFWDGEQVIWDLKAWIFPNGSTTKMT